MEAMQTTKETTPVNLGDLMDDGDDAVVTLVAGETRLVAHRAVLMDRSPVFAAMFSHDMLESRSGQVDIEDVEGPVLRLLLTYLYTLRVPQLSGMAGHLLVAADKYGVSGLKSTCEQQVAAQLSVETAADAAVLAVRHSCESLRKEAVNFIKANLQVMATQGWAEAVRLHPEDVAEVSRLIVNPAADTWRLIQAAAEGTVGELEALLAAGADVAARDENGWTALHWTAREGHVKAARWLVARRAPVDATDRWQQTPLHWAARRGDAAVVQLLLHASADHSARDDSGWTPLHWAAYLGNREAAAALLDAGADRGATDNRGRTALDVAMECNQHQLVVQLLAER